MAVGLTVDLRSASPAYEQVRAQIGGHIRGGQLPPGTKLPVVRALASDLGVAVNTIARAYQELEREGLVTTRRRVGTIVCDGLPVVPPEVGAAIKRLAEAVKAADLPLDTVLDLVRGRLSVDSSLGSPDGDLARG